MTKQEFTDGLAMRIYRKIDGVGIDKAVEIAEFIAEEVHPYGAGYATDEFLEEIKRPKGGKGVVHVRTD